jgi:hypothetical protein
LSKAEFARRTRLKLKDLQNWSYRLPSRVPTKVARKASRSRVRLVPVAVRPATPGSMLGGGQLLVDIRTLQIAVPRDADPRQVALVIAAVRETTC